MCTLPHGVMKKNEIPDKYLIIKYIKPRIFILAQFIHQNSIDILYYIFYIKNKISHLNRHIQSIELGRKRI